MATPLDPSGYEPPVRRPKGKLPLGLTVVDDFTWLIELIDGGTVITTPVVLDRPLVFTFNFSHMGLNPKTMVVVYYDTVEEMWVEAM